MSNIRQFERGTISYCLVATLTRPTTMVPAMSREKIIPFRETLDVAFEPKPKARRLHLKALNRSRSRNRSLTGRTMSSTSRTNQSSAESSEQPADDRSQDGSASEISHETGIDSIILQQVQTPSKVSLSIEIPTTSPTQSISGTISASVDVLRGGFLPGDYVPVRISVKHTRSIKSMQGVIVTFYRKAKIDAYPVIAEGKSPAFEDPVPKSRTGLKGLSLTNRGSHMYRMDLAQAFAPLIINPLTMEADVKTAVKIPEECFPTVTSVPGQMIVFTYHIEVIMDLGGKLSSQDRLFAGMNMTKKAPDYSVGAKISGSEHGLPSSMEIYHLIDTSEIRREKGVAQETIQVLIGSHDSKRKPGDIKKVDLWLQDDSASNLSNADELPLESQFQDTARSPEYMATPNEISDQLSDTSYPPQFIPSGFQEPTDEKSRLQLAEQRLLPSAPPDSENFPSSSSAPLFAVPSAPPISDLDSYYPANHITGAPNFHDLGLHEEDDIAPAYQQEISLSSGTITQASPLHLGACGSAATEDKAELERRRLLAMASSPDDDGDEEDDEEDGEKVDFQAAGIPFAPILDAGDTIPHHIQDLGPTLPGYAPKN